MNLYDGWGLGWVVGWVRWGLVGRSEWGKGEGGRESVSVCVGVSE